MKDPVIFHILNKRCIKKYARIEIFNEIKILLYCVTSGSLFLLVGTNLLQYFINKNSHLSESIIVRINALESDMHTNATAPKDNKEYFKRIQND